MRSTSFKVTNKHPENNKITQKTPPTAVKSPTTRRERNQMTKRREKTKRDKIRERNREQKGNQKTYKTRLRLLPQARPKKDKQQKGKDETITVDLVFYSGIIFLIGTEISFKKKKYIYAIARLFLLYTTITLRTIE